MDPLDGWTILEVGDDEALQACGRTLALLGAEVVKLEPPEGDPLRRRPPFADTTDGTRAIGFEHLAAGKRSVAIDPSTADGLRLTHDLLGSADVVIASSTHAAWLDLDDVPRPRGQVRAVAGTFGARPVDGGPSTAFTRAHAATTAHIVPGDTDLATRPGWGGPHVFEWMYGTVLAIAVVAERRRDTGGEIDLSYQGYGPWMDKMFFQRVSVSDDFDWHRDTAAYPYGGSLACTDGFACFFVIEEHQWKRLAHLLGHEEWLDDPRFADGLRRLDVKDVIQDALTGWCATRTVDQVLKEGRAADVPVGRVRTQAEVLAWPQLAARGFLAEQPTAFGHVPVVGLPYGTDLPARVLGPAPELGAHTAEAARGAAWTSRTSAPVRPTGTGRGRPLDGVRVLDFTWAAAGPIATSFLAYLGADVVKVEHRSRPDLMRIAQKQYGYGDEDDIDGSPSFVEMATGKRSIELDLRDPRDRDTALELATVADVLIENMRPGKIEALGLSYETVSERNPGIVMCSQSATARVDGPSVPGYAPIFWAEGGGSYRTGWPHRPPGVVRGPVDMHAAAAACLGTLALLERRERTGRGGRVDCSAIETVAACFGPELLDAAVTGRTTERDGNGYPGTVFNDVLPCFGEEEWVAVTARNRREWEGLADVLGRPDLAAREPSTVGHEELAASTRAHDPRRLEARLLAHGVPAARSTTMRGAITDARFAGRGLWQHVPSRYVGTQLVVGLPWTVDGQPYDMDRGAPRLGEHGPDVLAEWLGR